MSVDDVVATRAREQLAGTAIVVGRQRGDRNPGQELGDARLLEDPPRSRHDRRPAADYAGSGGSSPNSVPIASSIASKGSGRTTSPRSARITVT